MRISRREFLKYCSIAAGALGLTATDLMKIDEAFGKVGDGGPHVVWLPGQSCTGCTMSLTNSIFYTDVASLLLYDIDLDYNEQLAAASGDKAVAAAIAAIGKPMVLAIEGAIPSEDTGGSAEFCTIWTRVSGIVAAGSKVNGVPITKGTFNKDLTGVTLQAGDVLKLGSEITATTTIPVGARVTSAADRAALGGSYVGAATSGSNILNTNVTLAAPLTVGPAGDIYIWGGTSLPVNTIGNGSVLGPGCIVESSFDRLALMNLDADLGPIASPAAVFINDSNGNPFYLNNTVTLTAARSVGGPFTVKAGSILASGTFLRAGSRVEDSGDQLAIDPTLAKFGYGTTDADTLGSSLNYGGADYVLTGDIVMAASGASTGSLPQPTTVHDKTMLNESRLFGTSAAAILCIGTCAAFGGIPAAQGNLTGGSGALYKGLSKPGKYNGAMTEFAAKTVNIPGCPPHADWIVGTIAYLLKTNFALPPMEAYARPLDYFGQYQCNAGPCEWRYNQGYGDESNYFNPKTYQAHWSTNSSKLYKYKWANTGSTRFVGCLGAVGCKGRKTKADCSLRRWNADAAGKYGSGWCVGSGAGCHGCTEPTFPDKVGKFFNFA